MSSFVPKAKVIMGKARTMAVKSAPVIHGVRKTLDFVDKASPYIPGGGVLHTLTKAADVVDNVVQKVVS